MVKRLLVLIALMLPSLAFGQATLLPGTLQQFTDENGTPIAGGFICTTISGTTTNLATYPTAADANAGTNANTNPLVMDSAGRVVAWLGAGTYRIVVYKLGTGNTCNGTPVGAAVRTTDGVAGNQVLAEAGIVNVLAKFKSGSTIGNSTFFDDGTSATIGMLTASDNPSLTRFEVRKDVGGPAYMEIRNNTDATGAQAGVLVQSGNGTNNLVLGVTAISSGGTGVVPAGAGFIYTGNNTNGMWYATHNGNHTFAIGGLEGIRLNTSRELCVGVGANPCNARVDIRGTNSAGGTGGNEVALDVHTGSASFSVMRLFNDTYNSGSPAWEYFIADGGRLDLIGNADAKFNLLTHSVVRMSMSHTGEAIFSRNTGGTMPDPNSGTTLTLTGNTSGNLPSVSAFASPPIEHIINADSTAAPVLLDSFATAAVIAFRRADGTLDAPTAVQLNEDMGHLNWHGYGTAYTAARASIAVAAAENWTATNQGTRFSFWTTPTGSTTPVTRQTISAGGEFVFTRTCSGTLGNCMIPNSGVAVSIAATTDSTAPSVSGLGSGPNLHIVGCDGCLNNVLIDAFGDGATNFSEIRLRRANGTIASPSALTANEVMGQITGAGYGTSYGGLTGRASIQFYATENWTGTAQGTAVAIQSTTAGTATILTRVTVKDGVIVGAPTGDDKGVGTINVATNIYLNNTAYANPDFGLEKWATGHIVQFAEHPGASAYSKIGLMPLRDVESFAREHFYLPQLDVFNAHEGPAGMKERDDVNLLLHEETFIHLFEHEDRLTAIEARLQALEK